jgi:leader peptidase (prepilin peptidase) / N-methyltransferase
MFIIFVAIFGLIIGSFLNVVIARYPQMLQRRWRADCREFLELAVETGGPAFNLAWPGSQCPHCRHALPLWHNIPLISYLALRGRCGFCQDKISWQYPLVEVLTALCAMAIFLKFGWQWQALAVWLLSCNLIVLSGIDWKTQILPDELTLSFLWIGLLLNTNSTFTTLTDAVTGAVIGYILLWSVAYLFKIIRKKPGMGNGDFKMLAMIGAWLGLISMLHVLIIGIFLSLVVNLSLLLFKKIRYHQTLPFGPWLAMGAWLILWSQQ